MARVTRRKKRIAEQECDDSTEQSDESTYSRDEAARRAASVVCV